MVWQWELTGLDLAGLDGGIWRINTPQGNLKEQWRRHLVERIGLLMDM